MEFYCDFSGINCVMKCCFGCSINPYLFHYFFQLKIGIFLCQDKLSYFSNNEIICIYRKFQWKNISCIAKSISIIFKIMEWICLIDTQFHNCQFMVIFIFACFNVDCRHFEPGLYMTMQCYISAVKNNRKFSSIIQRIYYKRKYSYIVRTFIFLSYLIDMSSMH